jgi:magnesium-transporting ATPase (P-type)
MGLVFLVCIDILSWSIDSIALAQQIVLSLLVLLAGWLVVSCVILKISFSRLARPSLVSANGVSTFNNSVYLGHILATIVLFLLADIVGHLQIPFLSSTAIVDFSIWSLGTFLCLGICFLVNAFALRERRKDS